MIPRRRSSALTSALALAGAAVLALSLSACAPDGGTPSPSGSGTTASPRPSTSASTTPSATPTGDASACLIGTWNMDQAGLDQFYSDVNTSLSGAGVVFTPKGTASLLLGADGAFSWKPDTQTSAAVSGTEILIQIGGEITGTYTATADAISTATQSTDGLTVSATIDGAATDAGSITDQIAGAPITDSSYTCAGDTLTLVSDIGGAPATSVLHRG
jgi:hypothetical protein